MTEQVEVAIVGAGPYGLSLASHLEARNVPYRIFGRPMQFWSERMPHGMVLKSPPCESNISDPRGALSVRHFCAEAGMEYHDFHLPISLDTFLTYARWFRERAVPNVEEVNVTTIERNGNGFVLQLESGEHVKSRRVVVAAGLTGAARTPDLIAALGPTLATHASAHGSLEQFRGRRVAVVGAGQSALETAALLSEFGAEPVLVARTSTVDFAGKLQLTRPLLERLLAPIAPLAGADLKMWVYTRAIGMFRLFSPEARMRRGWQTLGPCGAWWLRDRFEKGVPVKTSSAIVDAREYGGAVCLTLDGPDGEEQLVVDHVIAATGYVADLDRFAFLERGLSAKVRRVGTNPELSSRFESSVPGLYFTGPIATGTFGPAMRFVYGSAFASKRIAGHRALASRAPRRRPVHVAKAGVEA